MNTLNDQYSLPDNAIEASTATLQEETHVVYHSVSKICRSCSNTIAGDETFCTTCGFPLQGSEDEQQQFINNRPLMEMDLNTMHSKIRKAANTLYVLAGLCVLSGIFLFATAGIADNPTAVMIVYMILAGIFAALGVWTKQQPLTAIISGLVLYIIVQLLAMVEDPTNIFKGIIIKAIIIIYLIKGIQSANEAQSIKKQWNL